MQLISVNVGLPREVNWKRKTVTTGIFKEPVNARVMVRELNLDGDRQADLTVHGGVDKAVYVYPFEHYDYWRDQLPDTELMPGIFGENFTVRGFKEEELNIGVHEVYAVALSLPDRHSGVNGDSTAPSLLQTRDSVWANSGSRLRHTGRTNRLRMLKSRNTLSPRKPRSGSIPTAFAIWKQSARIPGRSINSSSIALETLKSNWRCFIAMAAIHRSILNGRSIFANTSHQP
nr:MOSC domain-containing protein [Nostoc sp. ChiSLP03a]MDZ8216320.1 MOSC domain-containing protein [Nostoc sp. ChiSLP03a]